MTEQMHRIFNRARLDDRQVNELMGLAHGLIADGVVNQTEAEYLHKWLVAHQDVSSNAVVSTLFCRVQEFLKDGVLDDDEAAELLETLKQITGGDFEIGEILKSTTLPFDSPPPQLSFDAKSFCFTGTFAYGSRNACESAVIERGASAGRLTNKTDYLVIGVYATERWAHSSYGRKIEKAVMMQKEGKPVQIVGEAHWVEFLK